MGQTREPRSGAGIGSESGCAPLRAVDVCSLERCATVNLSFCLAVGSGWQPLFLIVSSPDGWQQNAGCRKQRRGICPSCQSEDCGNRQSIKPQVSRAHRWWTKPCRGVEPFRLESVARRSPHFARTKRRSKGSIANIALVNGHCGRLSKTVLPAWLTYHFAKRFPGA